MLYFFEFLLVASDVEGERDIVEDVIVVLFTIVFQVVKQALFVGEYSMVFDVVVGYFDLSSLFSLIFFDDGFYVI